MRGPIEIGLLFSLLLAPALGAQQVTLPLSDYEALRSRANLEASPDPPSPAPFAFEAAELAIAVNGESARIVQALDLTLFVDGWQKVPLGEAGSFIAAKFGGVDGRVEVGPAGWALHVEGRGRHRVVLESVVPVRRDETATRPTWQLGLRLPPAALVRGRVEASSDVEQVEIQGAGLIRREDGPGRSWTFVAAVAADTPETVGFILRGRRTLPERAQLPLSFETTSATAAVLSRTRLEVHGWIQARVAQGRLEALDVPVPAGFEVVSVRGPIAGWEVKAGRLGITPLEPVESSLAVEVELAAPPVDEFASPLLIPAHGGRSTLLAKAALRGDGLLELSDPGLVRAPSDTEAAGLSPAVQGAPGGLMSVLDPARPPKWRAEWADRTEVLAAQVDRLLVDVAVGESGRAAYQLWAEIRNRGAQQLVVTPPSGFELVEGHRDGEPVRPGVSGNAGLAVPLSSGEGVQVIHLAGLLPFPIPAGRGELAVPLPSLSAPAARVEVRVVLPGGRVYELTDLSRIGQVQAPPGSAERAARRNAVLTSNNIARQVLSLPGSPTPGGASALFPLPSGYLELEAAWSALSASPAPLSVRVRTDEEDSKWF